MMPQLNEAIERIVAVYYKEAKRNYNLYAINKKPLDHVFKSLCILKDSLKKNRKVPPYLLECAGTHEIEFLNNAMLDLKDSLDLSREQLQWVNDTYNSIAVRCLKQHPRTRAQKEIKEMLISNPGMSIELKEGKRIILARIRNMLLTQNI